jgi:ketosteroid isomerase-like protein
MPTNKFFTDLIKQYGQAWDAYDLQTILNFYHTPCFIYKSQTLFANLTEEVKARYFTELLESYRQQAYAKAETPHIEVKLMGQDSALVTVEWLCKRADGTIAFDFWDTYHFIRVDATWKILGDTVYDK